MKLSRFFLLSIFAICYGDIKDEDCISLINGRTGSFAHAESIPIEHLEEQSDAYLEGYIQAMIDATYYDMNVIVYVKERVVYLYNLPNNKMLKSSIVNFVEDIPEVECVIAEDEMPPEVVADIEETTVRPQLKGVWFPQNTVLFQPIIADPWEPTYSAGYRWGDDQLGAKVVAVSYGDEFPIFRWFDVFPVHGDLQIGITAGVWSTFKMNAQTQGAFSELVNTDYLVGPMLTYAFDKWSFRLRFYHISCHLGDEFLVNHPFYPRVNPSMEAIDFFTACQITKGIRLYFGPGWVIHSDDSFKIAPFYIEWGGESRFWGRKYYYHQLYGSFFLAVNFRNWQENDWAFDVSTLLGYEWSKLQGVGRKIRIFGEWHDGYCEGQFFKDRCSWLSVRLAWGF
ncbi:MAG: DUF1207 domain-containing protein [Simkaniaceae bacterium]